MESDLVNAPELAKKFWEAEVEAADHELKLKAEVRLSLFS